MHKQVNKRKKNKSSATASTVARKKGNQKLGFGFTDNQPETLAQRKLPQLKIREVEWGENKGKYYSDLDPERKYFDKIEDAQNAEDEWEDIPGSEKEVEKAELLVMGLLQRAEVFLFDNDVSMITDDALEGIEDLGRPRLSLQHHLKGNDLLGYQALRDYLELTNAQNVNEIEVHDGKKITVVKKGAETALQLYHKNPPMYSKEKDQLELFKKGGISEYFLNYISWNDDTFSNLVEALGSDKPKDGSESEERIKEELRERGWEPWDLTNNNIGVRLDGSDVIYDLSSVRKQN